MSKVVLSRHLNMPIKSSDDFIAQFPLSAAVVRQGIERGLHHGAQIYISQQGTVLADVGLGLATSERPMTPGTINPWLSAGKPLTAVVIAQLQAAGQLIWDDPVVKFLPEFASHGKSVITLRHLLTHTAGLSHVDSGWPDVEWTESLQHICAATRQSAKSDGETAGYDPTNNWFVLGEIIQRITGRSFADVVQQELLTPLKMRKAGCSFPVDDFANSPDDLGWLWERKQGELQILDWHTAPHCTRASPGSSFRGPIRELGWFYEMLLNQGNADSGSLVSASTVRLLTTRQRLGLFDHTFGHIVDFGFGFLIDSNQYGVDTVPYGYGRFCSPDTFGHGGSQSSQGYCDPRCGLVVAYFFNGRPGEPQHQRRIRAFNEAVYQDLQLAYGPPA